jgi:hypothetical protein
MPSTWHYELITLWDLAGKDFTKKAAPPQKALGDAMNGGRGINL